MLIPYLAGRGAHPSGEPGGTARQTCGAEPSMRYRKDGCYEKDKETGQFAVRGGNGVCDGGGGKRRSG